MFTTIKRLGKLSSIYMLGDILQKGAAFLLLPLYTIYLTPADYGIIAITTMVSSSVVLLLSFGLPGAIQRFHYQISDIEQLQYFYGTLWTFLIIVPGVLIGLTHFYGEYLFGIVFKQIPFSPYIELSIWKAYFEIAFLTLSLTIFRITERAYQYIFLNLLTFFLTATFTIWYIILNDEAALGVVKAQFYATAFVSLISCYFILKEIRFSFTWLRLKDAFAYSLPLIPHFIAHWGLGLSDRAILERYVSMNQIGIYSLGYQFGLAYQLLNTSINNALLPMFSRAAKDEQEYGLLPRIATYYIGVITFIGLAVALLTEDIILLLIPQSYHGSTQIIPWVVAGYLMMGLYCIPMNWLALTMGKTSIIPIITLSSAVVNIGGNLIFVPRFGIIAAAINTLVGYGVLFGLLYLYSQWIKVFPYQYGRICKIFLAILLLFIGGRVVAQFTPFINLGLHILILSLCPILLTLMQFWSEEEKEQFFSLAQPIYQKYMKTERRKDL
ncbi:MAG: oligosaccharide flippase family protein [Chloroflexota bacterium]